MKQVAAREAVGLLRSMTWVLCAVGLLALVFTTVNVTRFATSRDVPLPIAILLDPMIGTALAGVLYVDSRLASWGIRPPAWSTTLRWSAGCTAALMNSWESLWPDGQIGWPHHADPAAVLLHLTPALLLIALTETIAAYRRCVTDLLAQIGSADAPTAAESRSAGDHTDPDSIDPHPPEPAPPAGRPDPRPTEDDIPAPTKRRPSRPHKGNASRSRARSTPPPSAADVWTSAVDLDNAARATTGKPVSIWRLRTDLRIGPRRARQIHDRLLARHPDPPPAG